MVFQENFMISIKLFLQNYIRTIEVTFAIFFMYMIIRFEYFEDSFPMVLFAIVIFSIQVLKFWIKRKSRKPPITIYVLILNLIAIGYYEVFIF